MIKKKVLKVLTEKTRKVSWIEKETYIEDNMLKERTFSVEKTGVSCQGIWKAILNKEDKIYLKRLERFLEYNGFFKINEFYRIKTIYHLIFQKIQEDFPEYNETGKWYYDYHFIIPEEQIDAYLDTLSEYIVYLWQQIYIEYTIPVVQYTNEFGHRVDIFQNERYEVNIESSDLNILIELFISRLKNNTAELYYYYFLDSSWKYANLNEEGIKND